jgi:hypothetical protein
MAKSASLVKRQDGRRNNGKNFTSANSSPAVIENRERFRLTYVGRPGGNGGGGKKKNLISEAMDEALQMEVVLEGGRTGKIAAQHIAQQRVLEAMKSATPDDDIALRATQLILERTEGKPVTRTEVSGPDGGPIIEVSAVLTKLMGDPKPTP